MTDEPSTPDPIMEAVAEARTGFNLKERLRSRGLRTAQIKLYTDAQSGRLLGFHEVVDGKDVYAGVIGEIAKLDNKFGASKDAVEPESDAKRRKSLEAEKATLLKQLESTTILVSLQSVPEIIAERIARETRTELKLTEGQLIPADEVTHWTQVSGAKLLENMVTEIRDNADGAVTTSISYEDGKALREYLPRSEYLRLSELANDLQFKAVVADSVTKQADF